MSANPSLCPQGGNGQGLALKTTETDADTDNWPGSYRGAISADMATAPLFAALNMGGLRPLVEMLSGVPSVSPAASASALASALAEANARVKARARAPAVLELP